MSMYSGRSELPDQVLSVEAIVLLNLRMPWPSAPRLTLRFWISDVELWNPTITRSSWPVRLSGAVMAAHCGRAEVRLKRDVKKKKKKKRLVRLRVRVLVFVSSMMLCVCGRSFCGGMRRWELNG